MQLSSTLVRGAVCSIEERDGLGLGENSWFLSISHEKSSWLVQVFDYPTTSAIVSHLESKLTVMARRAAGTAAIARHDKAAGGHGIPSGDDALLDALYAAAGGGAATVPVARGRPNLSSGGPTPSRELGATSSPVAVTGCSFRPLVLPGDGASVLRDPGLPVSDAILPVPLSRWDRSRSGAAAEQLPAQFGAFMGAVELFDASAFGLSPLEALHVDPQHRLLLEAAADLAASEAALVQGEVGVYIGISWTEYHKLAEAHATGAGASGPYSAQGAVLR